MRRADENRRFEAMQTCIARLRALPSAKRESAIDVLLLLFDKDVAPRGSIAAAISNKVQCLLEVAPMTPKEMGLLLKIDSESAVFKNALTSLRKAGTVKTSGPKHARVYRLVGESK